MTKVAILGYGTVGSGVYEVLKKNKEVITGKTGEEITVKYVLDLREFDSDPVQEVLVHDIDTIISDAEVSIVCETMGGERPAYEFTKRALESGKSVCTSNKELVEKHGPELLQIAKAHACSYLFEASVGGGIPIIRPLRTSLAQEEILSITGIWYDQLYIDEDGNRRTCLRDRAGKSTGKRICRKESRCGYFRV